MDLLNFKTPVIPLPKSPNFLPLKLRMVAESATRKPSLHNKLSPQFLPKLQLKIKQSKQMKDDLSPFIVSPQLKSSVNHKERERIENSLRLPVLDGKREYNSLQKKNSRSDSSQILKLNLIKSYSEKDTPNTNAKVIFDK